MNKVVKDIIGRLVFAAMLCSLLFIAYRMGVYDTRHKNFDADRYAAEWGCLDGGRRACDMISRLNGVALCREYLRADYCPKRAEAFRKFLSQSSSGDARIARH